MKRQMKTPMNKPTDQSMNKRHTPLQIAIAFDQFVNTLLGGYADETLSARAWRMQPHKKRWALMRKLIDALFFWQEAHCKAAYESELLRKHYPQEYQKGSV